MGGQAQSLQRAAVASSAIPRPVLPAPDVRGSVFQLPPFSCRLAGCCLEHRNWSGAVGVAAWTSHAIKTGSIRVERCRCGRLDHAGDSLGFPARGAWLLRSLCGVPFGVDDEAVGLGLNCRGRGTGVCAVGLQQRMRDTAHVPQLHNMRPPASCTLAVTPIQPSTCLVAVDAPGVPGVTLASGRPGSLRDDQPALARWA